MSDIQRSPKVVELKIPEPTENEERYYKALNDFITLSERMELSDVIDLCYALQGVLAYGKYIGRRFSR